MDLSEGYSLARIPKEAKHVGEIDIRSVNSYLRPMSKADMLTTVDRKNGYIQLSAD